MPAAAAAYRVFFLADTAVHITRNAVGEARYALSDLSRNLRINNPFNRVALPRVSVRIPVSSRPRLPSLLNVLTNPVGPVLRPRVRS